MAQDCSTLPTPGTTTKSFCYGLSAPASLANSGVSVSATLATNQRIVWELISAPSNSDLTPGLLNDNCLSASQGVYDGELRITNSSRTIRVDNGSNVVDIVNNIGDPIYGTYSFKAYLKDCTGATCTSVSIGDFTIEIKERPILNIPVFDPTTCSDEPLITGNFAGFTTSNGIGITNLDFNSVTTSASPSGSNATIPATGVASGYIDNDMYTNMTNGGLTVTYNIIVNGNNGCTSDPADFTFRILAEPQLETAVSTVCSDDATGITLALVAGSFGNTTAAPNLI